MLQQTRLTRHYPQYYFIKGDVEIYVRLYKGVSAQEIFVIPSKGLSRYQVEEILRTNGVSSEKITWNHQSDGDCEVIFIATREFEKIFEMGHFTSFWVKLSLTARQHCVP